MSSEQTRDTAGSKLWKGFATIVFLAQAAASVILFVNVLLTGMIPEKYLYALGIILWLLLMVNALLLFVGMKRPHSAKVFIKRLAAFLLALLICSVSTIGSKATGRVKAALKEVTAEQTRSDESMVAMMNLYVIAKDPAKTAADCRSYLIGTAVGDNERNSKAALNKMSSETGISVQSREYGSEEELINALYKGKVQAAIINSAVAEILSETEDFKGFIGKARLIREYDITEADLEFIPGKPETSAKVTNPVESNGTQAVPGGITTTPFILYVSGSDTRNKQFKTSRSDVNILMVVNPKTKQILLLNTPRDYYIPNPKSPDGVRDKLTHLGIYGVGCSMKGLGDLYGCTVNHSVQINFTGLETLVDELGGITVDNPQAFKSVGGYQYKKGKIKLNGKEALAYARERYAFTAGDNMRGQNQMRIITAIINKVTASKSQVLMNYSGIMNALSGMFKTSVSTTDIEKLVKMQLDDMAQWKITSYSVTGRNGSETTYSSPSHKAYVMWPDDKSVAEGAGKIKKVLLGL